MCVVNAPSWMGDGVFTPNWAPANPAGGSQQGTCFCVVHTAINGQIDIDCRHYGDRELWIAHPVDINDHQESTDHHHQWAVRSPDHRNSPTTETSLSLMNKARETRERHTDKFHNSMSSLGFEPPNHGVAAIVANHWPRCVVMPLHEWATGSLPPAGRPPTRQVGPSEVHVSV